MAKRKTVKQARLDERAAQIQAQVAADRRRTQLIIVVFAVLLVGGAGLLYFLTNPPNFFGGGNTSGGTSASMGVVNGVGTGKAVAGAQAIPDEGRDHVVRPAKVAYKHQPPSSGNHYNDPPLAPRPWGTQQTEVQPEEFVHNLEHGGVVLVYRCSGSECDAAYAAAQHLYASLPKEPAYQEVKFLSVPYQGMSVRAALLAWDHEQDFSGMPTVADATAFYNQFVDKGPEATP